MSEGHNLVELIGHLGADVELKHTNGEGQSFCRMRVATTRSIKQENSWSDVTDWHQVIAWGALAKVCHDHIGKGSQVFISGRLQTREWEHEGKRQWMTEVVASKVIFLGKKDGGSR